MPKHDSVNHPQHYTEHPSGVECITVTECMNFCLGNAMKYIWRADLKNGTEDLQKAAWYINREIRRRMLVAQVRRPRKKIRISKTPHFMRPLYPSPELALIVGEGPIPRTEVVRKLWNFIKRNGLQDQKNRRQINVSENVLLQAVFKGKKSVSMFEMTKLLTPHLPDKKP